MRKKKTSKSSKNFSRMRERKVRDKRDDVNKSRVSIKLGNNSSLEWEKWTICTEVLFIQCFSTYCRASSNYVNEIFSIKLKKELYIGFFYIH